MTSSRRHRTAYERAVAFCRERKIFRPRERVLVGSGSGAASLGVLGFLRLAQHDLGLGDIAVGAIDFDTEDSADAVADAGRFARQLGANFYAISPEGRGPLESLRVLADREGFSRIALGHTRDDAVAHVFARLVRGVPLHKLRPLVARRRDGIVRPLLDLRDAEALELARTAGSEPVSLPPDPSTRLPLEARLRQTILPRLRVEVHGCDDALLRAGRDAARWARFLEHDVNERMGRVILVADRAEIPVEPIPPVTAEALADALLRQFSATAQVRKTARGPLAWLLRRTHERRQREEVLLGPGLIGTYIPERNVIVLRFPRVQRSAGEGIG